MFEAFSDFINEFFLNPINYPETYAPYNIVNTLTFAIAGLVTAYLVFLFLKKMKIDINSAFTRAVIPFIALGGALRVIVDAGFVQRSPLTVTPGIYFVGFFFFIAAFLIARKTKYFEKNLERMGILLFILALIPTLALFKNFVALAEIAALTIIATLLFSYWKKDATFGEKTLVFGQSLDGAASAVGVSSFGYVGQHLFENAVFANFGPFAFFILKAAFAMAFVHVARTEVENKEHRGYYLILATIFGLGPGVRNLLRIVAGV